MKRLIPLFVLALASAARAGDAPAHTSAMVKAAQWVQAKTAYNKGVGAPVVNGVTQTGKFQIPIDDSVSCGYSSTTGYGNGCPYAGLNGRAVNEPDNWQCIDSRQPSQLDSYNQNLSFGQAAGITAAASVLTLLSPVFYDKASLACNWTHFVSNPAIPQMPDAARTRDLLAKWADGIPSDLEANGANLLFACTQKTWLEYYRRVATGIHFVQDIESEHHGEGNVACSVADVVPIQAYNEFFTFKDVRTCLGFLTDTVQHAEGPDALHAAPTVFCDEAVVGQPQGSAHITLSGDMLAVLDACSAGVSLACMGFERNLRHHCKLPGANKSLVCSGEPSDHASGGNLQYCEGELFSGGGQDFLGNAVAATKPVLEKAVERWAKVCKEPDDPCVPAQCDTWCKRSVPPSVSGTTMTAPPAIAGYCVNDVGSSDCTLHKCACLPVNQCGTTGNPCCAQSPACADPANECGAATGRCGAKGTGGCNPWLGYWPGYTTSTCGYYTGPQTFCITSLGGNKLDFGVGYSATYTGNTAVVGNNAVIFTLSADGKKIHGHEADSCQDGDYTKQGTTCH